MASRFRYCITILLLFSSAMYFLFLYGFWHGESPFSSLKRWMHSKSPEKNIVDWWMTGIIVISFIHGITSLLYSTSSSLETFCVSSPSDRFSRFFSLSFPIQSSLLQSRAIRHVVFFPPKLLLLPSAFFTFLLFPSSLFFSTPLLFLLPYSLLFVSSTSLSCFFYCPVWYVLFTNWSPRLICSWVPFPSLCILLFMIYYHFPRLWWSAL